MICFLILLLFVDLALLIPGLGLAPVGALLLMALLPGLSWTFFLPITTLLRWITASALSYILTMMTVLLLSYLPGPVLFWQLLLILNLLALFPLIIWRTGFKKEDFTISIPLLSLILLALLFRTVNLSYSEFQGDEALAMISAAESLEGHEDALFLRSKGPAELLPPMAMWSLTGTINEPLARLPFTLAAIGAILTIYGIGRQWTNNKTVGLLAATFFALNGFTVAFGRIVQYQALVLWFSAMAFLWLLQGRKPVQLFIAGLMLGGGLLAHYDAILVVPALIWLLKESSWRASLKSLLFLMGGSLIVALPFYWPYYRTPQADRTSAYVGDRIGQEFRNNLPDFFHFNTFYSSYYYLLLTGFLVLGVLLWYLIQRGPIGKIAALLLMGGVSLIIVNIVNPVGMERWEAWAIVPFALLFLGAFWTKFSHPTTQAVIAWLAVPFLGYNFVVALGLTHIYTIVPAWTLLAAQAWHLFTIALVPFSIPRLVARGFLGGFIALSCLFLWNAFLRHDVEYWQDYPALSFFWDPYDSPPEAGFFGFAHRTGWKAIGQKIATGDLAGDYGSNEEPDVTTWYTRGAPRACDDAPEFYFLADDLIDPVPVPEELLTHHYEAIGTITLDNQKQMRIMQRTPPTLNLGTLNDTELAHNFDSTAIPSAFARSAQDFVSVEANFGNLIQLVGYKLNTNRAYPGGRIPVTLYWRALRPIPLSYQVFTHLENEGGGRVAQADGVPVCWTYPTDLWRPHQMIADQHALVLPADISPGKYPLRVGLYLADSFERLDVLDEAGNPAGTSLIITTIPIKTQQAVIEN